MIVLKTEHINNDDKASICISCTIARISLFSRFAERFRHITMHSRHDAEGIPLNDDRTEQEGHKIAMPNERTQSIVFAYAFLKRLSSKRIASTRDEMKKEADWVLRHFPSPYELEFLSEPREALLEKPGIHYPADSQKQNTVGDVVLLLERLDPSMRIVVDSDQGGFEYLRTVQLVPIDVDVNADRDSFGPPHWLPPVRPNKHSCSLGSCHWV